MEEEDLDRGGSEWMRYKRMNEDAELMRRMMEEEKNVGGGGWRRMSMKEE